MRLSSITEGIVSTSRGRIVHIKNDIADALVNIARTIGFPEPNVEFADSTTEDAIIYLDVSGSTLMIRIISDDDIQIQVPEELSKMAHIRDYYKLDNLKSVVRILRQVR